jgi:hypothetical protein
MTGWSRFRLWRAGTTREHIAAEVAVLQTAMANEEHQVRTAQEHAEALRHRAQAVAPDDVHEVHRAHLESHQAWDLMHAAAVDRDRADADRGAGTPEHNGSPAERAAALRTPPT